MWADARDSCLPNVSVAATEEAAGITYYRLRVRQHADARTEWQVLCVHLRLRLLLRLRLRLLLLLLLRLRLRLRLRGCVYTASALGSTLVLMLMRQLWGR